MIYIKNIQAQLHPNLIGNVTLIKSVSAEIQFEDYINLNGFVAFLQDFSRIEETEFIETPVTFGLQNTHNLTEVTLEISY